MQLALTLCVVALALIGSLEASPACFTEDSLGGANATTSLDGISEFQINLFKTLFQGDSGKNIFFSPYSIWSTFTLAYFGAQGKTKEQLRTVLGLGDKIQTLRDWRAREKLYETRAKNNEYIFKLANRAYFDKGVKLSPCVEKMLTSETRVEDMGNTVAFSKNVNSWVSNVTNDRIKNLLSPSDVQNANMVLANAAYFKGEWMSQFKKSNTKKDIFYTSQEKYKFVPFMKQKGSFGHVASEALQANILELPYSEDVSMIILLPPFIEGPQGFSAMVSRLNGSVLDQELNKLWTETFTVKIPKFTLSTTIGDELMMAMRKMGVTNLFDPTSADLSDFASGADLSVGKSIHKAFLEVSEEGTEAAAATALISFRIARPVNPDNFIANHPFVFLIRDNKTKNILFMGAYKTPEDQKP